MEKDVLTSDNLQKAGRSPFSKVRVARELLKAQAQTILEAYLALSAEARDAGKLEVAEKILWNLIDHIPREDGEGIIDSAASKPKEVVGLTGPTINIGLKLGGMETKALPVVTEVPVKK